MRNEPILAAFDRLVNRDPCAPLVATRDRVATRGDVLAWARAAQQGIARAGAPAGSMALLAIANGAGFLAGLIACRKAGLVPVLSDAATPAEERARIARALGVSLSVLCDTAFPASAADFRVECREGEGDAGGADFVKLTSGSTGEPSGIGITADALSTDDDQLAATMGLEASDRFLATIPWSHSYGLSSLVLPALKRGSLLVLSREEGPWSALDSARAWGATVFPSVPAQLGAMVTVADASSWPPTLRTVISAGARLAPETAARFREAFAIPARVFYGASECGGISFDREGGAAERGTVGTPVEGIAIRLDREDTTEAGSVTVRSAAAAFAYLPRPSDRLGAGEFRSADLAAWTDGGELRLLGRCDAVVNVAGKKVQPAEVEDVLRAMPGVRDAAVLGIRSPSDDRETLRAVVACDRSELGWADVRAWCRRHLAAHKVPRSIVFVDRLPRTGRGKIDRVALSASPSDGFA